MSFLLLYCLLVIVLSSMLKMPYIEGWCGCCFGVSTLLVADMLNEDNSNRVICIVPPTGKPRACHKTIASLIDDQSQSFCFMAEVI